MPVFPQAFPLAPGFLEGIQDRSAYYRFPFRTVNSVHRNFRVLALAGPQGRKAIFPALVSFKTKVSAGSESKKWVDLEQEGGAWVSAGLNLAALSLETVLRPCLQPRFKWPVPGQGAHSPLSPALGEEERNATPLDAWDTVLTTSNLQQGQGDLEIWNCKLGGISLVLLEEGK